MDCRLRLLIAEREATCLGIRMALGDDVEVCAEASDPELAIRAAKREQPDMCLVGWDVAGAAVRGISRAAPGARIVVLAPEPNVDDLLASIRAGAVGYATGSIGQDRLRKVVRAVAADEAVIPRKMVLELLLECRDAGESGEGLTGREAQVLGMLRRGHSTAEIADRLRIAPVTVRRHISEIVHKLGVENRSSLIASPPRAAAPRTVHGV